MLGFPASDVRALVAPIGGLIGRYRPRAIRRRRVCEVGLVVLHLIQDLQLHRGLSSALLDGQAGFRHELDAVALKLQRSLHALGDHYGERHPVFREAPWRVVLGRWEALRNNWRSLDVDTNFAVHAEVIGGLIGILRALATANAGLLGAERSQALRCWPAFVEHLGMLRALGVRVLGSGIGSPAADCTKMRSRLQTARLSLQTVADAVPDAQLLAASWSALQRVDAIVLHGPADGDVESYYAQMTALIDDWYRIIRYAMQDEP